MRGGTYSLIVLALNMPRLTLVIGFLGREVDFSKLKDHLDTDVPEFLLQIHKYNIPVSSLIVKPIKSSLLRGTESIRFTLDHGIPSKYCEVHALVLPSRRFEIDKCVIEKRK